MLRLFVKEKATPFVFLYSLSSQLQLFKFHHKSLLFILLLCWCNQFLSRVRSRNSKKILLRLKSKPNQSKFTLFFDLKFQQFPQLGLMSSSQQPILLSLLHQATFQELDTDISKFNPSLQYSKDKNQLFLVTFRFDGSPLKFSIFKALLTAIY